MRDRVRHADRITRRRSRRSTEPDEDRRRLALTRLAGAAAAVLFGHVAFVVVGWRLGISIPVIGILLVLSLLVWTFLFVHDVRLYLDSSWMATRHRRDIYERLARSTRDGSFAKPAGLLQKAFTRDLLAPARAGGDVAKEMSALSGAVGLPVDSAPWAHETLGAVCVALGHTRTPFLLTMPTDSVNAWVAGPMDRAAIAVTRGMLGSFAQRELEAVFAGLLVRAEYMTVAEPLRDQDSPSSEFHSRFSPEALLEAGMGAALFYSAADDAAVSILRDPSLLIDALGRTREALSCDVPGISLYMASRLWAWPVTPRTTGERFDVQAERLRALLALDEERVNLVLAAPEREWYFTDGDEQRGPVQESHLQELAARGRIRAETWVWSHGMHQWQPARVWFRVSPPS